MPNAQGLGLVLGLVAKRDCVQNGLAHVARSSGVFRDLEMEPWEWGRVKGLEHVDRTLLQIVGGSHIPSVLCTRSQGTLNPFVT